MSAASNTDACFREFIGVKVVGFLRNALPVSRRDLANGTRTLVFEDGRGLTISSRGSFWIESAEDVQRAVAKLERELRETHRGIEDVLRVAGAV